MSNRMTEAQERGLLALTSPGVDELTAWQDTCVSTRTIQSRVAGALARKGLAEKTRVLGYAYYRATEAGKRAAQELSTRTKP